jgi:OPA family glycerol-3-phosphate transporter-like MFS transporter/OPA family sugar phosphate sensor protein UhpC-like MFS transporter
MEQTIKKYRYWEWRTIVVLFVGYALFYFVRKNLGIAIPAMEAELGISKTQLGLFLTLHSIIYGFSRFINGLLVDRFSKRKIMSLGLLLTCLVNLFICFSPKLNGMLNLLDGEGKATLGLVYLIGSMWVLNGYLQGMGVPPCVSLLAHWIRPTELATKQSIWNVSHTVGAGVVVALCGYILNHFGYSAWYLCFAIPACIALLGVFVLWFGLKDDPSEVGLPSIEELTAAESGEQQVKSEDKSKENNPLANIDGAKYKKIINKMVFANPYIWIIAISNFCVYVIRLTILDWGASFLTESKGMDIAQAGGLLATTEIVGGTLGMLLAGWLSDKLFKSKAHRTCFFCIIFATLSFFLFWKCDSVWLSFLCLVMSAFFIYGPQALYGVCASQQATKYAAGTGNGIVGIFGYASSVVSGVMFGSMADAGGWDSVFPVAILFGVAGAIAIGLMWNAPANGYEKLNKIIEKTK